MDKAYYLELAKARLERAEELLEDARDNELQTRFVLACTLII